MTKRPGGGADALSVANVTRRFGPVVALDDVSLDIAAGEFVTILGASGSGKTTLLRTIAGFDIADRGQVMLGGRDITQSSVQSRDIGMVFQNYALFPHMSVAQNVAFPLRMRHVPKADIERRVTDALALVELSTLKQRKPSQLSGGQQQRVALARAIVFQPTVLLLDEPFGALDRKLRESMQIEIRSLQQKLGLTTLFITHDQEEALTISDRIAVMERGRILQVGPPAMLYDEPVNETVAAFIGESNLLPVTVDHDGTARLTTGEVIAVGMVGGAGAATIMIRPERLEIVTAGPVTISTSVLQTIYLGWSVKHVLRTQGGVTLLARVSPGTPGAELRPGDPALVYVDPSATRAVSRPS